MKKFLPIYIVLFFSLPIFAQEVNDSSGNVIDLSEIVIEGKKEIRNKDHVSLYLSDDNTKFGTNALDAISTLNRFSTQLNSNQLFTNTKKAVTILINGVPSTADILRSYKADQIKRVDFYDNAPSKYRTFTDGPLVNVIVKKRLDYMTAAYVNTANNVSLPRGMNSIYLTFADSLNMVKVNYQNYYQNYTKNSIVNEYLYHDNSFTHEKGDNNNTKLFQQSIQASYQRAQNKSTFNANLSYNWSTGKSNSKYDVLLKESGTDFTGSGADHSRQWYDNASLDLYYNYDFSSSSSLYINAVAAYGKSGNTDRLFHEMPSQWDFLDYDILNNDINRVVSIKGQIGYDRDLFGGSFSASARYTHKYLKRRSSDTYISRSKSDDGNASVGMIWYGDNWYVGPDLGVEFSHTDFESVKNTSVLPSLYINASLQGKGKLQPFTIQLNPMIGQRGASVNSSIDNITFIDRRYIMKGNPELKPNFYNHNNLTISYYAPDGLNYAVLYATATYDHHPTVPLLYTDGEMAVRQLGTIPRSFSTFVQAVGQWAPFKWLRIMPYVTMTNFNYDTPSNHISKTYWRFGGGITFVKGPWNLLLAANSPTKEYSGDFMMRGSAQYAAIFHYRLKDWTFGAEWHYSGMNEKTIGSCDGFSTRSIQNFKQAQYAFQIDIIWSFSKGYSRRRPSVKTGGNSSDSGLDPSIQMQRKY